MIFTYVASGGLNLRKCGTGVAYTAIPQCYHRFNPGDTAWLGYKAAKGTLEYVVVKKMRLITRFTTNGVGDCIVMYVDTFNALYNEWDLVTLDQANAMVSAYNQMVKANTALAECFK